MQRLITRSCRTRGNDTAERMPKVVALFCICAFVSSLLGYAHDTDPFTWLALGVVSVVGTSGVESNLS